MTKLRTLRPRLGALPPRIGVAQSGVERKTAEQQRTRQRDQQDPSRKLYNTRAWRKLREEVYARDGYVCQKTGVVCIGRHPAPNSPVADHIVPHHGDPALFWDKKNIQTVSKAYHDSQKQREERRSTGRKPRSGSASGAMARPTWFRKAYIPLTVVCGPPGAGKSTYVNLHTGPQDLVICFDQLAQNVFGAKPGVRTQARLSMDQVADVLRQRNELLGSIMRATAREQWVQAWLIVSEPKAEHRLWWQETTGAKVIVLATPEHECLRRIEVDAQAGDVRGDEARKFVSRWWHDYRPASCDQTVK